MSIYKNDLPYGKIVHKYGLFYKEYSMEQHVHKWCEIMYVVKGSCKIISFDSVYHLKEHQFVFLDEGQYHSLVVQNDTGCNMLDIEFVFDKKEAGINKNELARVDTLFCKFLNKKLPLIYGDDTSSLGLALKDLVSHLNKSEKRDYLVKILFERVLLELAGNTINDNKNVGIQYVKKATKYIEANYFYELTVDIIADEVGVNKSYLQGLFHNHFGCGIISYVNNKRLDYAKFLLLNTKKSIIDIAVEVGYNSRQHFTLSFKNKYDLTPQHFRSVFSD